MVVHISQTSGPPSSCQKMILLWRNVSGTGCCSKTEDDFTLSLITDARCALVAQSSPCRRPTHRGTALCRRSRRRESHDSARTDLSVVAALSHVRMSLTAHPFRPRLPTRSRDGTARVPPAHGRSRDLRPSSSLVQTRRADGHEAECGAPRAR